MTEAFSRTLLSRIEDAGLNASAPPQQRWVDGWLVRCSPGKAQRARCINALSEGVLPIAERLTICHAIYRQARLRLLLRITPFSRPPDLDAWLERRNYQRFGESWVMVCEALDTIAAAPTPQLPAGSTVQDVGVEVYAHIIGELRGTVLSEIQAHAQRLSNSPVPYRASVLRSSDGRVLACAQRAIENDCVGLYDVFTVPTERGRGLSRALCAQLLAGARQQGARVAYLQVEANNHAARAVYRRMGFVDAYAYHYRALPLAADAA